MKRQLAALLLALAFFPAIAHSAVKEWTVLVFINGHNNLDTYGDMDINEMEKVGSTNDLNILVQRGSMRFNTTRLYVTQDNDPKKISSQVVQDFGKKVDMGNYQTLTDFVKWGAATYPAKHYFVVVWNHGAGWHRTQRTDATRGISYDDVFSSHITTAQLGQSMKDSFAAIGHKIDIYGSDACLMQMPEVASQMIDYVDVYVGSEETEPLEGWPYDYLLKPMAAKPTITPLEVSKILTTEYVKSYQGGSQGSNSSVTFSGFDMSYLAKLETGVGQLAKAIIALPAADKKKVLTAAGQTQDFYYSDYKDLGDFLKKIEVARIDGIRGDILADINTTLQKFVISSSATTTYAGATGTSFWLPSNSSTFNQYKTEYFNLEFHRRTDWGSALEALFK